LIGGQGVAFVEEHADAGVVEHLEREIGFSVALEVCKQVKSVATVAKSAISLPAQPSRRRFHFAAHSVEHSVYNASAQTGSAERLCMARKTQREKGPWLSLHFFDRMLRLRVVHWKNSFTSYT
jgi:hypothetical protein